MCPWGHPRNGRNGASSATGSACGAATPRVACRVRVGVAGATAWVVLPAFAARADFLAVAVLLVFADFDAVRFACLAMTIRSRSDQRRSEPSRTDDERRRTNRTRGRPLDENLPGDFVEAR